MIKRFREMLKSERTLSLEVRLQLVSALFYPFASLVAGALAGVWIAATVTLLVHDVLVSVVADLAVLVALIRIAIGIAFVRHKWPLTTNNYRQWEFAYALPGALFAAALGSVTLLALLRVDNEPLHLMLTTTTAAYAASIAGRNAGRPWVALSQLYLAAGPMCLGLILNEISFYQVVGYALFFLMFGMTDITVSIRQTLVGALETKRQNAELAGRSLEQANLFDAALNNMSHGLCMFDQSGLLLVWNQKLLDILRYSGKSLLKGMPLDEVLGVVSSGGSKFQSEPLIGAIRQSLRSKRPARSTVRLADERAISISRQKMANGNVVIVFEDVTEQAKAQDRIQQLAWTDELTGLMNRASFKELMKKLLEAAGPESRLALHLIDLDNFKSVNDTLGHPIGDELLIAVSKRISGITAGSGHVARLGGDEFVIIQPLGLHSVEIEDLAAAVIAALGEPFEILGQTIIIGASIGIALAPEHGSGGDVLFKRADMALYQAKSNGRHSAKLFEYDLDAQAQQRRSMELDIRTAVAEKQFTLAFQPIVSLETGEIVSLETLIRWRHPIRGFISPAEFIPIAEEIGLIVPIGRWVLEEACKAAKNWHTDASVAVNFSAVQFTDKTFPQYLTGILAAVGLPASRLELEITETALLDNNMGTLEMLAQFRAIGVGVSLDDFGTGYSSLSQLRTFPFTKIKIDGSFVRDLGRDPSSLAVIRAVSNIGKILNIVVVAECVESEDQLQFLVSAGCDEVQGYLLGRPETDKLIGRAINNHSAEVVKALLAA
jgi:diguanylate cyclase (GGDEF)-like protein